MGHQADVGDGTHGLWIKGPVFLTKVNGLREHPGIGAVGYYGLGVLLLAVGIPHLPGGPDHGRHGGIDDDVRGDVQVGDAVVGVDHRDVRSVGIAIAYVRLDGHLLLGRQGIDLGQEVPESVS